MTPTFPYMEAELCEHKMYSQCSLNSHSSRKDSTSREKKANGPVVSANVPHVMSYVI